MDGTAVVKAAVKPAINASPAPLLSTGRAGRGGYHQAHHCELPDRDLSDRDPSTGLAEGCAAGCSAGLG